MNPGDDEVDPALADEVDAALAAVWSGRFDRIDQLVHSVSPGEPIADIFSPLQTARSIGTVPDVIGRFRIVRELGRGGMGVVFEAEQSEPRRRVALKIIRGGGLVDDYHRRLFQREIQTLAHLSHPGIAALYEAGQTDDGLNYYAMELVEGCPLTDYIRRPDEDASSALSTRRRIELLTAICDAIHYAHQRGVIHRDLKPSNIFITNEGQPKVLDFGLARLSSPESDAPTVNTTPGQLLGTLPYMSPEQARGDGTLLDVRTDIYSLGVIAYEMIAGAKPIDLGGVAVPEAVRRICEMSPRPLSQSDRSFRGDLATIIHKALAKDAPQRYASAAALADDLRAYLTGMPISARPPSASYQLRKLIARHRLPFTLASLLVLSVFTFGAFAGWQAIEVARERDAAVEARKQAEQNQKKSDRINEILQTMLSSVDPEMSTQGTVTVADVLDNMAREVDRGIVGDADIEAAVRRTLGGSYLSLGDLNAAEKQLRRSYEIRREMFGDDHPWTGRILSDLGELLRGRGEYAAAAEMQSKALDILRHANPAPNADVARSKYRLALVRDDQDQLEDAERLLKEVLEDEKAFPDTNSLDSYRARLQLGGILRNRGRYDEAEKMVKDVMDAAAGELGPDHQFVARALNSLAVLYEEQGRYREAAEGYREALRIKRLALPQDHPSISVTLSNLGGAQRKLGDLEGAERSVSEALDAMTSRFGPDYKDTIVMTNNLAGIRRARGDFGGAEYMYRDVVSRLESKFGAESPYLAGALNNLGTVLRDEGKWEEAADVLARALEISTRVRGPNHIETARAADNLGGINQVLGRLDEAEHLYQQALASIEAAMGRDHPLRIFVLCDLASLERERGDCKAALEFASDARKALEQRTSRAPEEQSRTYGELGQCLWCAGKSRDAIPALETALSSNSRLDRAGLFREEVRSALALAYLELGDKAKAASLMSEALEPFVEREGRFGRTILTRAVSFYESSGDILEAANWQKRLDALNNEASGNSQPN